MRLTKWILTAALVLLPAAAHGQYSTPVREVEKPAKTAVNFHYNCSGTACASTYVLPANQRLVIEMVNIRLTTSNAPAVTSEVLILSAVGQDSVGTYLPTRIGYTQNGDTTLHGNYRVSMYADYKPNVSIYPAVNINPSYVNVVTIYGYLVAK
jgi:hypothetical protein